MAECFEPKITIDRITCGRNQIVPFLQRLLAEELRSGGIPGMAIIPVSRLAERLKVAVRTMQKVYDGLEADGLIERFAGRRTYHICGRSAKNFCLAVLLPTSFISFFQPGTDVGDQHFRLYCGIANRAAELGYSVMAVDLPPPDATEPAIEQAVNRIRQKCFGVIHFGGRGYFVDPPLSRLLECRDLVQVSFNCVFDQKHIGAVTFDGADEIGTFVTYTREFGHQRFCYVLEDDAAMFEDVRYMLVDRSEVEELFAKCGVAQDNLKIIRLSDFKSAAAWRKFLNSEDVPTAFLCRNDNIAATLMAKIKAAGFRVPEDFSVVGFNNMSLSQHTTPPLTTFENPLFKIGSELVDRLSLFTKLGVTEATRLCQIKPMLIGRQSVDSVKCNLSYN